MLTNHKAVPMRVMEGAVCPALTGAKQNRDTGLFVICTLTQGQQYNTMKCVGREEPVGSALRALRKKEVKKQYNK